MTIEAAFVDTLRAINKLDGRLREVERLSSTTTMATKKGRAATLASDAFTATFNYYRLTPEAGNTDDLSTINGGLEGRLLAIRTADAAYTITVKDGVGNIDLCGSDVSLDCEEKVLVLVYDSNLTAWIQYGVGSGGGGASDFLSLSDTPGAYAAQAGKHVRVNATPDALEFADPTFLELTDTPSSYASQASKYVSVNGAENALEFTTAPPGSVSSTVRNTFDFLNSAKASADTPDDEFDGGSLDVKWTVVAGSNAAMDFIGGTNVSNYALDTTNDVLQMQVGSNGSQLVQLRQDWTLGDGESIVVAFSPPIENIGGTQSNNQMNVLMTLNDDDTSPSSGNYLYISFDLSANHHHVQLYNGSVVVGDSIDENPASSTTWFLRFARDGTDYHGFWSTDGASWGYLGVDTGGDVFDNLWIHVENLAAYSAPALVTTWHWVRQGTNGVFPWSPMVPVVTSVDGNSSGNIVLNAWMPDAPPESPSAYDDEFDDSSFDTGLWTEFDPNTLITVTEDEAGLRIQETGVAGDDNCGIYQSIPSGDFTIETKVSISGQDTDFYIGGLTLWEDPTDVANGNMDMFVMSYYSTAARVMYYRYTNHETFSGTTFTGVDVGSLGSPVYLRLRRNGTTYYYAVSGDGVAWLEVWTGSLTFTPTAFGLGTNITTTSAPDLYVRFQFFRYRNSDVGNHGLLYGRRVEAKNGVQNLGGLSALTISSGVVTISSSTGFYSIAAETGTSDDLTTINGGSDGDIIVLCPDTGDTISVLETGNLQLSGTFTMDDPADKITLIYHSAISKWCEITSSGNA